jgi:hypothetical protein
MIRKSSPLALVISDAIATADTGKKFQLPFSDVHLQPVRLFNGVAKIFAGQNEGVLVITHPLPEDAGLSLQEAGWAFSKLRGVKEGGWTRFHRVGSPVIHLCIRRGVRRDDCPLFDPEESDLTIAHRLGYFHHSSGVAWRGTPAMTGHSQIRNFFPDTGLNSQPIWRLPRPALANTAPIGAVGPLVWKADPDTFRDGYQYVHQFDTRSAYMAAAAAVNLPWAGFRQSDAPFDKDFAGYWLVRYSELPRDILPIVNPIRVFEDQVWLTTPIMNLVQDLGHTPEIITAFTSAKTRRILRPWAEKLRDMLYLAEASGNLFMRDAVKQTCNRSIGSMARESGRIYRPTWADLVIDYARANLIRKIRATLREARNAQLIQVRTDAFYLLTDTPAPPFAHGIGARIGNLRYEGCSSLVSLMEGVGV